MGFWDSFKAGYAKGTETGRKNAARTKRQIADRQGRERRHIDSIRNQSDSSLLRDAASSYLSDEDRAIVEDTLRRRGYVKDEYGHYDKRR